MTDPIRHIQLPMTEAAARQLELGQVVTISGLVSTGRSRSQVRAIEEGLAPPLDFDQINCFFHAEPVMRETEAGWEVVSIEPISSMRCERYGGAVVRKLGLRTLIGKTMMGPDTAEALREVSAVHLTKIGVCGDLLCPHMTRVVDVHFLEGPGKTEGTRVFDAERLGPFFMDMDASGRAYFEDLDGRARGNLA